MSFERLKKEDLKSLAESFAVDLNATASKAEIIAALAEDGITWEMAKQFDQTVAKIDAEVQAENKKTAAENRANNSNTLLRMMRANPTFHIRGYKFTKDHPFGLVTEEDAEWITENVEGFRYASPKEAEEFYG